jgi:hypothetical protein
MEIDDAEYRNVVELLRESKADNDPLGAEVLTLIALSHLLDIIGVDEELREPFAHLYHDRFNKLLRRRLGNRLKPLGETMAFSLCAALVTVMGERGIDIGDSLDFAAKQSGLDRQKLKEFRDDLLRTRASAVAVICYRDCLEKHRRTFDEIEAEAR